jgi:hypothetical protein
MRNLILALLVKFLSFFRAHNLMSIFTNPNSSTPLIFLVSSCVLNGRPISAFLHYIIFKLLFPFLRVCTSLDSKILAWKAFPIQ